MDNFQKASTLIWGADLDYLLGFCEERRIAVGDEKREDKSQLIKLALRHLNSEAVENSADGGKAIVDKIVQELAVKVKDEMPLLEGNGTNDVEANKPVKPVAKTEESDGMSEVVTYHKFRECKINGTIGDPGEKGCLIYTSLAFQIRHAELQHYSDAEIYYAVIKAIKGGNSLRSALEMKEPTKETMRRLLRSHFQIKNQMSTLQELRDCVQMPGETAHAFCCKAISLRETVKVLYEEDGKTFDPALLNSTFFRSVFTGIKQNNIRMEVQHLLKAEACEDADLLDAISAAASTEEERANKSKSKVDVKKVTFTDDSSDDSDDNKKTNAQKKKTKPKKENALLTSINKLTVKVEALSVDQDEALKNVQSQVEILKQQMAVQSAATAAASVLNVGAPPFNNPLQVDSHPRQSFRRPFGCRACVIAGSGFCNHCFKCGSVEHKKSECPN